MDAYRPGQGKTSRTLVLLTGWFLIAWGSISLSLALPRIHSSLTRAWNEFDWAGGANAPDAIRLDLVLYTAKFGPALTIAVFACAAAAFWWWRFVSKPKWADLLIEMEGELKKVSWPTPSDAWQSTLVVTGFTVALVITTFVYDIIIRGILELFSGVA